MIDTIWVLLWLRVIFLILPYIYQLFFPTPFYVPELFFGQGILDIASNGTFVL